MLIREIVNGSVTERHLCSHCAQENGISALFDADSAIGRLLSGFLGRSISAGESGSGNEDEIACSCCGMTYGEFIKEGKFGCSECYETFGLLVQDNIKKLQGSDSHVGKHPKQFTGMRPASFLKKEEVLSAGEELKILAERQREAVLEEDYEEAAALRDRIRELKLKMEAGT